MLKIKVKVVCLRAMLLALSACCTGSYADSTGEEAGEAKTEEAKTEEIKPIETEVQLNTSVGIGMSASPIVLLSRAIQKDKTSNRFRLNWSFAIAGQGGRSTALYDRKQATLKLHSTLDDILGKSYRNFLYTQVTDATLIELAETYRTDEGTITDLSFIDRLPNGTNLGGTYISYAPDADEQRKASGQKATRRKGIGKKLQQKRSQRRGG